MELAQSEYQLPRLTRMWSHLERQAGGRVRGMGEKQIEVDKRLLRSRISALRRSIEVQPPLSPCSLLSQTCVELSRMEFCIISVCRTGQGGLYKELRLCACSSTGLLHVSAASLSELLPGHVAQSAVIQCTAD